VISSIALNDIGANGTKRLAAIGGTVVCVFLKL
jgi:hypothetical protein